MSQERELDLPIPAEAARQRADRFVADRSGLSRSFVQRLISEGHLTMDGMVIRASATLVPGQTLHLVIPPVSEATANEQVVSKAETLFMDYHRANGVNVRIVRKSPA